MEILVNKCYGGFGYCHEAHVEYLKRHVEREGLCVYAENIGAQFKQGTKPFEFIPEESYGKCRKIESVYDAQGRERTFYTKKDFGDLVDSSVIPTEERFQGYELWGEVRVDPIMIEIFKEMGDAFNDDNSKIQLFNIPDDVEWEVLEDEGWETVVDKNRMW